MEVVKNGQKQEKKATAAMLKRRIDNAIVMVECDKYTKSIYFSDRGLRLSVNESQAVISTGAHSHVFEAILPHGDISRPFIYTKRLVEIALENDCIVTSEKGYKYYSFAKLLKTLQAKEDKVEYNICWFVDIWLFNIFSPLYEIDETEAGSFLLYERYMHNIARHKFLLEEHKEDVTNKEFFNKVIEIEKELIGDVVEAVIIKAKSDEDRLKEEMEALQKNADEASIEGL